MGSTTQNPPQNPAQDQPQKASASFTWIFTWRGILANLPVLFALVWTRGETSNLAAAWALALVFVFLGTAVRVWAQQHIQHRWRSPMKLTGSGPYQMVRNPLYIGNTLVILGATASSGLLWMMPVALVWCALVFTLVVRYEERDWLNSTAREPYKEFLAQVPRWLPRSFKAPQFFTERFGRAVVSELHCFLVLLPFIVKDWLLYSSAGQAFWNSLHL